jgi:plastocyanin
MNNKVKILLAAAVVMVVVAGALLLTNNNNKDSDNAKTGTSSENKTAAITITYDSNGFSPSTVTVQSGDSIKVINKSDGEIRPSSDPHPTHTDNPELNLSDIQKGQSATFTVTSKGSWGYHNHYSPDKKGTIVVE